jgi:acylphosphatase
MPVIHKNIFVYGHVQGVFFRATAKKIADNLGVKGMIRNEPDGKVYVEAEGEEAAVNSFAYWCNEGPSGARVRGLEINDGLFKGYSSFEIVR